MRAVPTRVRGLVALSLGMMATLGLVTLGLVTMGLVTGAAQPARADIAPPGGTPKTVSADALPTVQINGVVWSSVTVGNTVYATGSFTRARPAGVVAGGAGEVTRDNILSFDIRTGKLLPWNPSLNAQGRRIVASPSGDEIYVGGDFTTVDGVGRKRIAGFKTATGALDPAFKPSISGPGKGIAVTADTVYVGGGFGTASTKPRNKLAAFARSDGALLPWAPSVDDSIEAMAITADGKRVIVGGRFDQLNGQPKVGIGAIDATTGATAPWSSTPIPKQGTTPLPNTKGKVDTWNSWVTDLKVVSGVVYGSANGQGTHVFDGRFAASAATGDLIWMDNCYGATYGVQVVGSVLYSVGHAHDCDSLGEFGETTPQRFFRGLAETIAPTGFDKSLPGFNSSYARQPTPSLLHWFPTISAGSYTGQIQGPWTVTGNSDYIALGGEFPKVNGVAQQGLVRFAMLSAAPGRMGPAASDGLRPSLMSFLGRDVSVRWKTTSDQDDASLTYRVYRDAGTTPVRTVSAVSKPWKSTNLSFTDPGVPAGTHTYTVKVTDSRGNTVTGPVSASTVVAF